eukprot:TRINITY_DN10726_c0_g2_i1.p1 TRINITY_DN10726_c0_g2~~TRINITY_DN10726_c0_g2_i1.p1  ORF type:complete len:329 (-),score=131.06 TRINITY_DN10726_c0_g2_i1:25-1011(-)
MVKVVQTKYQNLELTNLGAELTNVIAAKRVSLSSLKSEIAKLKKELNEVEGDMKSIKKVEGVDDVFHKVMPRGIKRCKKEYESLEKSLEEAIKEYEQTAEAYCENPKIMEPEVFFETMCQFVEQLGVCVKDIEVQRLKEEKQKKREQEAEKKRIKEEEKKKKKEEDAIRRATEKSTKNPESPSGAEEGVMDSAMAALKGGQAFEQKRKARQEKRKEEEKAMSSVMDTLSMFSNRATPKPAEVPKKDVEPVTRVAETQPTLVESPVTKTLEQAKQQEKEEDQRFEQRQLEREARRKEREEQAKKEEEEAERKKQERKARLAALRAQSDN